MTPIHPGARTAIRLAAKNGRRHWREEVRQGRLKRPRIDLFLYHYLTLMLGETVLDTQSFAVACDLLCHG